MARLWLFNPWNDLALGSDSTFYTPPPQAAVLAQAAGALPVWMGCEDDYVVVDAQGEAFVETMRGVYPGLPAVWRGEAVSECVPWGWSNATRQEFLRLGVNGDILPSDEWLDNVRSMSHRRHTVIAHRFMATGLEPVEALTLPECEAALDCWGRVIGKYPWSSTGRGLFGGSPDYRESFLRRCQGAIHHQGSVMIEPLYDVVQDFAMLFYCTESGVVEFHGYSLFNTTRHAYTGNIILPQREIEVRLQQFVGVDALRNTCEAMQRFLVRHLGGRYSGPVGVDMFVYRKNEAGAVASYGLNPCVEINLRYTMGFLSLALQQRRLPMDFHGELLCSADGNVENVDAFMWLNGRRDFCFYIAESML